MGIYDKKRIINRFERVGIISAWFNVEASQIEVSMSSGDGANSRGSFTMSSDDAITTAKAILKNYGVTL